MGIGSGIDVSGIISQLMAVEQQPLTVLQKKEASYQAQVSALGTLQSSMSDFQTAVKALSDPTKLQTTTATLGNTSVGTATADSTAQVSSHSLSVTSLASNQVLASARYTNTTDPVGTGSLTIAFGSYDSTKGFTANTSASSFTVNIDSSNNNIFGVRDAINSANKGVTASVINDGTGFRLVMSSNNTGASNSLKITSSDTTGTGLSKLTYDPASTTNTVSQTQAASDASFSVDGVAITKASNTVSDVIPGVTLNLTGTTGTTPTTLTVGVNTDDLVKKVQAMVDAYNSTMDQLNTLTGYDATTGASGILNGQTSLNSIKTSLRAVFNQSLGTTNSIQSLYDVGLSFGTGSVSSTGTVTQDASKAGVLNLDTDKLKAAITANPTALAGLFATAGSTSKPGAVTFKASSSQTQPGTYPIFVSKAATQGSVSGPALDSSTGFPVTIDSNNASFSVGLDGVQSGEIKLTEGTVYNSAADLAAAMQTAINNDSQLKAAGVSASVAYDTTTGAMKFTSNSFGSTSNIQVNGTSPNSASIGLGYTAVSTGSDAVATIGGQPAKAVGNVLTGTGAAAGMIVTLSGGSVGDMGTVSFSQGFAYRLNAAITSMSSTTGVFTTVTAALNKSITGMQTQEAQMQTRLTSIQANYVTQFTAMDTLIGQLKSTSSYLTQQLANLPGVSSS
ncbi:hypothetical protein JCM19000A_01850 [Silvimonas sp. JCM 19000]